MHSAPGETAGDRPISRERESAIQRLARSPLLPARQRLELAEELVADVQGLARRLEADGLPPAEARRRALERLAPSGEAVHELEQLHGGRRPRWWGRPDVGSGLAEGDGVLHCEGPPREGSPGLRWPTNALALAVGSLLFWGLPPGAGAVTLPLALAMGVAVAGAAALVRQGWPTTGEDAPAWRRALRFHLATLVVLWSAALLGAAVVVDRWLEPLGASIPGAPPQEAAGALGALFHPLLAISAVSTAVTLVALVHLTLLLPRVADRLHARDAVEEIVQVLLQRSR